MLARSLNTNQKIILLAISHNRTLTISSLLRKIEKEQKISLSTLKLNSKILRELRLIESGNGSVATLTELGSFSIGLIGETHGINKGISGIIDAAAKRSRELGLKGTNINQPREIRGE